MIHGARMLHVAKCITIWPSLLRHNSEPYSHPPRAVEGLLYMAPACCLWLILGVAVVEWPRMAAENALGIIAAKPGLYLMAAAMGFGVNSLAYIVIQLASSLTLKARREQIIKQGYEVTLSCIQFMGQSFFGCAAVRDLEPRRSIWPTSSCSLPVHLRTALSSWAPCMYDCSCRDEAAGWGRLWRGRAWPSRLNCMAACRFWAPSRMRWWCGWGSCSWPTSSRRCRQVPHASYLTV